MLKYSKSTIPTQYGYFDFYCFIQNNKENIALVAGDIYNKENVITRIHSECFTGDLIKSLKCDCGDQLDLSLKKISSFNRGLVIYLKQEGRGIGLFNKLKAYDLQEKLNLDTIESNKQLGFETDYRTYEDAIEIINFFNLKSVSLITNNPEKIKAIKSSNISVNNTISLETNVNPHNQYYLQTKQKRLSHRLNNVSEKKKSLFIHVSYAQSINGTISLKNLKPISLSNKHALTLTHFLRSNHNAILIGKNTLMHDNPQLTVRLVNGDHPQPCILDTNLSYSFNLKIFNHPKPPWFFTASNDKKKIEHIESCGGKVFFIKKNKTNLLCLKEVCKTLENEKIESLLVEGGKKTITRFLDEKLVDKCLITIAPSFFDGTNVIESDQPYNLSSKIKLSNISSYLVSDNVILEGNPTYV